MTVALIIEAETKDVFMVGSFTRVSSTLVGPTHDGLFTFYPPRI